MIRGNKRFIEECCQCIRLKCSRELHGDADQHGKSNRVSHENLNKVFGAILLRGKVLEVKMNLNCIISMIIIIDNSLSYPATSTDNADQSR